MRRKNLFKHKFPYKIDDSDNKITKPGILGTISTMPKFGGNASWHPLSPPNDLVRSKSEKGTQLVKKKVK